MSLDASNCRHVSPGQGDTSVGPRGPTDDRMGHRASCLIRDNLEAIYWESIAVHDWEHIVGALILLVSSLYKKQRLCQYKANSKPSTSSLLHTEKALDWCKHITSHIRGGGTLLKYRIHVVLILLTKCYLVQWEHISVYYSPRPSLWSLISVMALACEVGVV